MKTNSLAHPNGVPESFLSKFGEYITAILCGFDRLRFRATQRLLFQPNSMEAYLATCGVLIKHFKNFAEGITERVKAAAYKRRQLQVVRCSIWEQPAVTRKRWHERWRAKTELRRD